MIGATPYKSFVVTFLLVAPFFIHGYSQDSSPSSTGVISGNCTLNFTSYPYQPTGECVGTQQRIKQWDSFRTTLCCRNALTVFSQALALRLFSQSQTPDPTTVFLRSDCNGSFLRQPKVSAATCGFSESLTYGVTHCSNLTLRDVTQTDSFNNASSACSAGFLFGNFDDACDGCAAAVLALRDNLLEKTRADKDKKSERTSCTVAAVVSVVSGRVQNRTQTEDFFQCLRMLDQYDPDYIKIRNSLAHILVALIVAITTIMLLVVLIKHVTKKKTRTTAKSKEYSKTWSTLYRFSKEEIDYAINHGNERKSLGRGSAGHVYKGVLPSGQPVAIKHINRNNNQTDSFKREAETLSRIRHPNLVCLFGYCMEEDGNYLVYEYCSGGNLAQQLIRKDTLLNWDKRVRILRDCALALRYLHHYVGGCIVHSDIKLTNILLTDELEPKLSDSGLAKMMNVEESEVFTDVGGTIGYMDPEYITNAKLISASDVYSFGIVILQILSGQKVNEMNFDARDQLIRKAKDVSSSNHPTEEFADPKLNGKFNKVDFKSILQIAVLCVANSSLDRPTIDIVFNEMNKAWRNTSEFKQLRKARNDPSTSSAALSTSMDGILPV